MIWSRSKRLCGWWLRSSHTTVSLPGISSRGQEAGEVEGGREDGSKSAQVQLEVMPKACCRERWCWGALSSALSGPEWVLEDNQAERSNLGTALCQRWPRWSQAFASGSRGEAALSR